MKYLQILHWKCNSGPVADMIGSRRQRNSVIHWNSNSCMISRGLSSLLQFQLSLENLAIPDHAFFDNGLQPQNLQYCIQQAGKESIKWSQIWILDPWCMSFGWLNSWFSAQLFSTDMKTTAPKTMWSKQIPDITNTSCSITLFSWAPNPAPNRTFPHDKWVPNHPHRVARSGVLWRCLNGCHLCLQAVHCRLPWFP